VESRARGPGEEFILSMRSHRRSMPRTPLHSLLASAGIGSTRDARPDSTLRIAAGRKP
jgi:hypothetical protein